MINRKDILNEFIEVMRIKVEDEYIQFLNLEIKYIMPIF